MSKPTVLLTASLAAAAVVAVGAAALPATAASHGRTLHYSATFVSDSPIDLGKKGDSAGDRSSDVAVLKSHGSRVGTFVQDCVLIRPGKDPLALCTGTLLIGGSTLVVSTAPSGDAELLHGAVLGGTGRFAAAAGTFAVKTGETAELTIHLAR